MKKICLNDGVEFESKRKDAKFCPAPKKCRQEYARKNNIDEETGEIKDAGVKTITVPSTKLMSQEDQELVVKANKLNISLAEYKKRMAKFHKMGIVQVDWLSTGIPEFDALTKIPKGRVTHIFGPEGVGKTTLCLNLVRGLRDKKVFYADSEASLNPELLMDLGVDPDLFHVYNETSFFEDIAEKIKEAAESGQYDIVILDSLAACTTRAEFEGKITDRNIGQKAFFMGKLLHMTQAVFKNTNTAFVVINQERDKIGGYVPEKYTPGGTATPYAASLSIRLKTIKSWRFPTAPKGAKKHTYLGHEVEATIIKSKVNSPWRTAKFPLHYEAPAEQDVDEAVTPAIKGIDPTKKAF